MDEEFCGKSGHLSCLSFSLNVRISPCSGSYYENYFQCIVPYHIKINGPWVHSVCPSNGCGHIHPRHLHALIKRVTTGNQKLKGNLMQEKGQTWKTNTYPAKPSIMKIYSHITKANEPLKSSQTLQHGEG